METTKSSVPAVAYLRVSTEEQAAEGVSLAAQEKALRAYCAMRGFELVEIVTDAAVSGGKPMAQRDGGARVLSLIRRRKVRAVVALKLDRLFRSCADCLQTVQAWNKSGVALHLIDLGGQAVDTSSATGLFFLTVMAGAAELERNQVSERTRLAMAHRRSEGRRISGWLPYGYRLAADGENLEEHPQERRAVVLIARLRAKGYSLRKIADGLNRRNVQARGKRWHKTSVARIIEREAA